MFNVLNYVFDPNQAITYFEERNKLEVQYAALREALETILTDCKCWAGNESAEEELIGPIEMLIQNTLKNFDADKELLAQLAAMREALESMELLYEIAYNAGSYCDEDSIRAAEANARGDEIRAKIAGALAPNVGKELLAQLAALREALEWLKAISYSREDDLEQWPGQETRIMIEKALAPDAGKELLAQLAAMRKALEHLQSDFNNGYLGSGMLPMALLEDIIDPALAPDAGRKLLERLAKTESELDERRELQDMQSKALLERLAKAESERDTFERAAVYWKAQYDWLENKINNPRVSATTELMIREAE